MEKRLPWSLKQPDFPKPLGSGLIALSLVLLMQIPEGESAVEIPERDAVSVLQHWLGWGPGAGGPAPSLSGEVIVGSRMLTQNRRDGREGPRGKTFSILALSDVAAFFRSPIRRASPSNQTPGAKERGSGTSRLEELAAPACPLGSGSAEREGRAALGGSASGETGRAGGTSHPGVRQVREVAGRRRRPGSGSGQRRRHHVSGRGGAAGRALGAERAAAVAVAAACRPRSSRRPQPAPAQRSVLAPVPAGASSWTAAAAARGPGGQQSYGTPPRDQGKESTSCGRRWQRPRAPE